MQKSSFRLGLTALLATGFVSGFTTACAPKPSEAEQEAPVATVLDDFNPFAADAEEELQRLDEQYAEETGAPVQVEPVPQATPKPRIPSTPKMPAGCYQDGCTVFALVDRSEQRLYLYFDGELIEEWPVSTGEKGFETPNFDTRPNGRLYKAYTSKTYPGGDYDQLGNMPYAVFIKGGFAIHGTGRGNWKKLGKVASHGCIRLHPENAKYFYELVKEYGVHDTWITVQP